MAWVPVQILKYINSIIFLGYLESQWSMMTLQYSSEIEMFYKLL